MLTIPLQIYLLHKNMARKKNKIIGIDARFYGPVGKGLGRYTQEIVDNVITIFANEAAISFVIFLSTENFKDFICDGIKVKKVLIKSRWYTLAEQFEIPFRLWQEKVDLAHFPHFNVPIFTSVPFVVTIHDLILTKFPTYRATTLNPFLYWLKDKAYRLVISSAVKNAQKIITVSNFTKNDLIEQFKVDPEKVVVTYEGIADLARSSAFLPESKEDNRKILELYDISTPFLLYVGNAYPHKNLEALISAFGKIRVKRPSLRLVLVGKEDYFYNRVKDFAASRNFWQKENHNSPIIFPGYVPDINLGTFFSEAAVYVFPSLYEGFGLPPLEAMAHGCPIASSNRASMPEILGDAAAYFDPENQSEIISLIENILDDSVKREKMITRGFEHVKKYNWQVCAKETSQIYLNALNNIK